jgi:hypothetical protein
VALTPVNFDLTHRPGLDHLPGWDLQETLESALAGAPK